LGENPDREGLVSTPRRIAKMYTEIFAGYSSYSGLAVNFTEETDLIIAKDIQFYSMCEHHMLPFFGKIHIAYIPSRKVFGISNLVRLVEKYAKRLQIQKRGIFFYRLHYIIGLILAFCRRLFYMLFYDMIPKAPKERECFLHLVQSSVS
jgi:GTP cyclohydrolase I-like protein